MVPSPDLVSGIGPCLSLAVSQKAITIDLDAGSLQANARGKNSRVFVVVCARIFGKTFIIGPGAIEIPSAAVVGVVALAGLDSESCGKDEDGSETHFEGVAERHDGGRGMRSDGI